MAGLEARPSRFRPAHPAAGSAAGGAAGLTPAALQQQQHMQQQQQQQIYAAPQAAALPGGYAGPAGGIPQQPLAGVNQGLYGAYARQVPAGLGSLGLAGGVATLVQQPNGGALPYAVPGGGLGAQVGGRSSLYKRAWCRVAWHMRAAALLHLPSRPCLCTADTPSCIMSCLLCRASRPPSGRQSTRLGSTPCSRAWAWAWRRRSSRTIPACWRS